jgi:polyhydroxyalkanoate synthesis regulator phasin
MMPNELTVGEAGQRKRANRINKLQGGNAMASGVEELLGMLYDMIEEGKPVTMHAEQCKIDRDRALDLLDEIRAQFPVELGEARKMVAAREEYISSAKREADAIRNQAQETVKHLLNENELMQQAKDAATSMVTRTQEQCRDLRQAANAYCENLLKQTEESMSRAATELHQAQTQFRQLAEAAAQEQG